MRTKVGFERFNFKAVDGWCFGYAPVSKAEKGGTGPIREDGRTLNITKLGASPKANSIIGITVIWTARRPYQKPVIVGVYRDAIVFRQVMRTDSEQAYITKAAENNCLLIEENQRDLVVPQKQKGFPGQAAAWFPGLHSEGPASSFLIEVESYLQTL